MSIASGAPRSTQTLDNMLRREQLLHLFSRFDFLTSQPDVKKRIADAVKDKQEAVAVTTAIQEEILREMGIDPRLGISCLGKAEYPTSWFEIAKIDREEMAIDEAELEPHEFAEKMDNQQKLQEQQLEMLKYIRKFHPDDQSAILETLHKQMESANFDNCAAILTLDEIVRRRSTPASASSSLYSM